MNARGRGRGEPERATRDVAEADFGELAVGAAVELALVHGESPMGPQASTVKPIRQMAFRPERRSE